MLNAIPRKCTECGKKSFVITILAEYRVSLKHDGQSYEVIVPQFRVQQCRECGEITLDHDAGLQLDNALRRTVGLLMPVEITAGRKRLGLTQKQLADSLGISDCTLSRWESGVQFQQRAMDRYLRSYFEVSALRDFLTDLDGVEQLAPQNKENR